MDDNRGVEVAACSQLVKHSVDRALVRAAVVRCEHHRVRCDFKHAIDPREGVAPVVVGGRHWYTDRQQDGVIMTIERQAL